MKKRNCRRTREEKEIHDKATRIRKMTDEQMVRYISLENQNSYDEGYRSGLMKGREGSKSSKSVLMFLDDVERLKGIGAVTLQKLRKAAETNGYI